MLEMDTLAFIQSKFSGYYVEEAENIDAPTSIEQREFGFILFKEKIMIRHKGFKRFEDFVSFLKQTAPAHVYYSTAYYQTPEERMENKGWLGADLYFDIDADHIPTACGKIHDRWTCKGCGFAGRGMAPDQCPICNNRSFEEKIWPCEVCLESAKLEAVKLLDILTEECGLSPEEVKVSFSGHRGYHVQVEDESLRSLESVAHKEIVDYVTGTGLDPLFHGFEVSGLKRRRFTAGPKVDDFGWRGRIARGIRDFFASATEEDLKSLGLNKKAIDEIIKSKEGILKSWERGGPWNILKGINFEQWTAIIKRAVESQSVKIDTVVTTDIHRLIRMPKTLHGGTGLLKVSFPTDDIEEFDPLKDSVAFKKGEATIYVEEAPKFRLGDEEFGPFKNESVELPMAAAIFLLCKGAAKVIT
jgi:DNA primase small subunit